MTAQLKRLRPATTYRVRLCTRPAKRATPRRCSRAWKRFGKKYQRVFYKQYPELVGKLAAIHHAIPQAVFKHWPNLYDDAIKDSLGNLRGIPDTAAGRAAHREITNHWNTIIRGWRRADYRPSKSEIERLVELVDEGWGHNFLPRR